MSGRAWALVPSVPGGGEACTLGTDAVKDERGAVDIFVSWGVTGDLRCVRPYISKIVTTALIGQTISVKWHFHNN
jgi:hypothetical protein